MNGFYLIDWEAAERIAASRKLGKTGLASQRTLNSRNDVTGCAGEMAFEQFSGLGMDIERRMSGDGGIDFTVPLTVDVKTTSYPPKHMLVEEYRVKAAIYVLAHFVKPCNVDLKGWMWGYKVKQYPVDHSIIYDRGINNHLVPVEDLYPMTLIRNFLPGWNA